MFSLQQKDELVFGTPIIYEGDKKLDDLILDHSLLENNIINFSTSSNYNKGKKQSRLGERRTGTRDDDHSVRRVMHRDIERKRRQEMSELYASLRSLLPIEQIQGKCSVGDHMLEAMNYIKHLHNNIQELKIRRDKMKTNLSNLSASKDETTSNGSGNMHKCVTVNLFWHGVEILISSSVGSSEFGLSRVLAELLERGLNVTNCVSTKIKGRFLHRIQAEASDVKSLDLAVLQERLADVFN